MGVFNTKSTTTMKQDGDVLRIDATDDFAGGLVVAGGSLKVTLQRLVQAGDVTEAQARVVYTFFVDDLQAALEDSADA